MEPQVVKFVQVAGAATMLVIGLVGCASVGAQPQPVRYMHAGATIVPSETVEDLVTYGDVAVVFTVVEESEVAPTAAEVKRGEGTITRLVTARQDGKPVWTRPSRAKGAPAPATEWEIADGGWLFHGDKRTRLELQGRPRLEVGEQYLAVRTFSSLGGQTESEWFSLGYIPLAQGRVQIDGRSLPERSDSYLRATQGLSVTSVADLLVGAPPDARAAQFMDLDAAQRYQKIFE